MKKTLLIIAPFIGLGNVNAQSDATLNETIEWLETYGVRLTTIYSMNKDARFEISGNRIYMSGADDGGYASTQINQKKSVKSILLSDYKDKFHISLNGGAGKFNDTSKELAWVLISFQSKDDATRFYKALIHLYSFYEDCNPKFENKVELENKF